MAKVKSPIFSFSAQGSLTNQVSYRQHPTGTVVQAKPHNEKPPTLARFYQRGLFRDYLDIWETLTTLERQTWAAKGAKTHRTGMQAFLSYYLRNLPDINAWYRFDRFSGPTLQDSSICENHATNVLSTLTQGAIGQALTGNGVSSYISIPKSAEWNFIGSTISIEFFVFITASGTFQTLVYHWSGTQVAFAITISSVMKPYLYLNAGVAVIPTTATIPLNRWCHVYLYYTHNTASGKFYLDGQPVTCTVTPRAFITLAQNISCCLRLITLDNPLKGKIDNLILWDRILTPATILAHAQRRFP